MRNLNKITIIRGTEIPKSTLELRLSTLRLLHLSGMQWMHGLPLH